MAKAAHLDRAFPAPRSETSLCGIPVVAGVLKRLARLMGGSFVLAISPGPLFAPATASGRDADEPIRILLERDEPASDVSSALPCRSHKDGRQPTLLELA